MTLLDTAETRTAGPEEADEREETRELTRGTNVARYIVLDQLGKGGMGVVYSAYDPELDRQIALKILRAKTNDSDSGVSKRLKREAQALAHLQHPNVIAVHDVGIFEGDVFLAMEFVRGTDLRSWLSDTEPSIDEVVDIFVQAGRGLAAAHSAGLIHRDFKPDNVIVGDEGRVRVLDFGLARAADMDVEQGSSLAGVTQTKAAVQTVNDAVGAGVHEDTFSALTYDDDFTGEHTGTSLLKVQLTEYKGIQGTPPYMAPEQFSGDTVDSRADQYSYCAALFEAVCGYRPVKGRTVQALRRRVMAGKIEPIPSNRHIPRHIRQVLRRGLSLHAGDRYPDMDMLLRELQKDTAARVRRVGVIFGLLIAIAVFAWVFSVSGGDGESPCGRAAERLDGVWNEDIKTEMRNGFLASGREHADATYKRASEVVDAYAESWRTMRIETCQATRVRGEQSQQLLDLRMQCLERRLGQADALIRVLSDRPTKEVVDEAVTAAYRLPTLDLCADRKALTAVTPPPEDKQTRDRLARLSERLHTAEALEAAGSYSQGLAQAEWVVQQARELNYSPFTAEALYRAGSLSEKNGAPDTAEERLLEASKFASSAGNALLHAKIWTELLRTVGHTKGLFAEAEWIGHIADATIRSVGEQELSRAELLSQQGSVAFAAGKLQEAYAKHSQALQLRRDKLRAEHPDIAQSLSYMGASLARQGRLEESTTYLQRAMDIYKKALGEEHPLVAEVHSNLGATLTFLGRSAEAYEHYLRALNIYKQIHGSEHEFMSIVHGNLGELLWLQGQYERARTKYLEALEIAERIHGEEHPFTVDSLIGLGRVYLSLERARNAAEVLEKAERIRVSGGVEPANEARIQFYLLRARLSAGEVVPDMMFRIRAAYERYRKTPLRIEAESMLMQQWFNAIDEKSVTAPKS